MIFDVLPGNYENRSYNQPLIVDKTKSTMGDTDYYYKIGNIVDRRRYNSLVYPEKTEGSKLPGDPHAVDFSHIFLAVDTSASGYRLPFDDEWSFLMRAGASMNYYWGNQGDSLTVSRYAWVRPVGLKPVAQLLPNRFVLHDMMGIAAEQVIVHKTRVCLHYLRLFLYLVYLEYGFNKRTI